APGSARTSRSRGTVAADTSSPHLPASATPTPSTPSAGSRSPHRAAAVRRAAAVARGVPSCLLLLQPELHECPGEDDDEEDECDGGRNAEPPPAEPLLVHQQHEAGRRPQRSATRHHVRLREELEVADHRDDADE